MTVSTPQTEPMILDVEFMPTTHFPRIDPRGLVVSEIWV
jgi:hypothetical protein